MTEVSEFQDTFTYRMLDIAKTTQLVRNSVDWMMHSALERSVWKKCRRALFEKLMKMLYFFGPGYSFEAISFTCLILEPKVKKCQFWGVKVTRPLECDVNNYFMCAGRKWGQFFGFSFDFVPLHEIVIWITRDGRKKIQPCVIVATCTEGKLNKYVRVLVDWF